MPDYYVKEGDSVFGPVTEPQISRMVWTGRITSDSLIATSRDGPWRTEQSRRRWKGLSLFGGVLMFGGAVELLGAFMALENQPDSFGIWLSLSILTILVGLAMCLWTVIANPWRR
jgi:hypothetical protein